jgi:hypothetical protein
MNTRIIIFIYWISFTFANASNIICKSKNDGSYDCSNKNLNISSIDILCEVTYSASSLNLANNNLNFAINNFTFDKFKLINRTLNLSSNKLEKIEKYAFYHDLSLNNDKNNILSLNISILDLSDNFFKNVPWQAIEKISSLRYIYFNKNSITNLDMSDYSPSCVNYLEKITHFYSSSCGIKFIDQIVFSYLTNLILIDISQNNLKNLDFSIGIQLIANFQNTNIYTYINTSNNPLECNCNLLWFKKYLLMNKNIIYNETLECLLPKKFESSNQEQKTKNTTDNIFSRQTIFFFHIINIIQQYTYKSNPIISLTDSQFICDLKLTKYEIKRTKNNTKITLNCVFTAYPMPEIVWIYSGRVLDLDKRIRNDTVFKINKEIKRFGNLFETASSIEFSDQIFLSKIIFYEQKSIACKAFLSFVDLNQIKISYNHVYFNFNTANLYFYIFCTYINVIIVISLLVLAVACIRKKSFLEGISR